jgi:pSer/pThr/pTyr-binding forkhead associated (FHA) protein
MGVGDTEAASGHGVGGERLRLKVAAGNAAGTLIEVRDELLIGRQAAGAGTLANDIEISRQHARISKGPDGRYLIEDLGSTNGTWINGRRVERSTVLEIGDRIEVGASELIVQIGTIPEATPPAGTEVPDPAIRAPEPVSEGTMPEGAGEVGVAPVQPEAPATGHISLRIEVDLEAMEATVVLDEDADSVTFVHEDGRWRLK